ncbi:helix-turn-helix domain-containing protein [Citrobacter braakii]|uniref:helix-turn-helix domain-containing protein n=1 Tax=Citrobacter braakii TaxID=57706 RepID=UPI00403941A4
MSKQKENIFSFTSDEKEKILERIKSLFRGRSLRKTASDWSIPYSTMNNYFLRTAIPGADVLLLISKKEGVSLEWLLTGEELPNSSLKDSDSRYLSTQTPTEPNKERGVMLATWEMIFNSLGDDDAKALLSLFMLRGAQGIIKLAQEKESAGDILSRLDADEQERLLALHEAKKGALTDGEGNEIANPTHRRAG